jgi:hypothetical protein
MDLEQSDPNGPVQLRRAERVFTTDPSIGGCDQICDLNCIERAGMAQRRAGLRQRRLHRTANTADGRSLRLNRELDLLAAGGAFEQLGRVAVPVRQADPPHPILHAARTTDAIVCHAQKIRSREFCSPFKMSQSTIPRAPGRNKIVLCENRGTTGARSRSVKIFVK